MSYLAYLVLAATTVSAQDCHPHLTRDEKDAIETLFDQLQYAFSNVKKEQWVSEWVAKHEAGKWIVQRKDGSLNVYVDAKTGCLLRYED